MRFTSVPAVQMNAESFASVHLLKIRREFHSVSRKVHLTGKTNSGRIKPTTHAGVPGTQF
jgi:hypothetical protein